MWPRESPCAAINRSLALRGIPRHSSKVRNSAYFRSAGDLNDSTSSLARISSTIADKRADRALQQRHSPIPPRLVGTVLAFSKNGVAVKVRIAAVNPDPADRTGSVFLHDFRLADTGESLCEAAPDGQRTGFPLSGLTT